MEKCYSCDNHGLIHKILTLPHPPLSLFPLYTGISFPEGSISKNFLRQKDILEREGWIISIPSRCWREGGGGGVISTHLDNLTALSQDQNVSVFFMVILHYSSIRSKSPSPWAQVTYSNK